MNATRPVRPTVGAAHGPPASNFQPRIPQGIPAELWRRFVPANNPLTPEKVQLGEALYFDRRLSADGSLSCATCHDPSAAFADHNPRSVGIGGRTGTRNAPTTLNAMFSESLFWDGRARTLEEQVRQPLVNPSEMGMPNFEAVVERLSALPEYRRSFRRVFKGEGITIETIAKAIASFERTRLSGDSPFDRFIAGGADALSETQKRGWELFRGKAQCVNCHAFGPSSPFFTDFKFYNTGVASKGKDFGRLAREALLSGPPGRDAGRALNSLAHGEGFSELGRYLVTRRTRDIGAFKTPTLRDVELTAPYMHDGSLRTLLDVVRFYDRGGEHNPHLDERVRPLGLTDREMSDLVDFMRALTSDEVLRQATRANPQTRTPVPVPAIRQIAFGGY